ncbi:hypothetical protein ACPA9J_34970 [Pseudomonas aeruginosa]
MTSSGDGRSLEDGSSHADEALITGESLPVRQATGDKVTGERSTARAACWLRTAARVRNGPGAASSAWSKTAQAAKAPFRSW